MSMCCRPVIETQTYAHRTFARCLTCRRLSPPGEDDQGPWSQQHHADAVAVNALIGDRAVSGCG